MAVQTQIQTRRGTAATWTSTNPTLAAGEIGYETDTGKFKIGDGTTAWASLAYNLNGGVSTSGGSTITVASGTTVPLTIQNNGTGNSFRVNDVASDTTPFIIDAAGLVGIGTTAIESGNILHIAGNAFLGSTSGTIAKVTIDSTDNRLILGSYFESGVGQYGFITSTNNAETGNSPLLFNTGTTERMRITSAGLVGIGVTPSGSMLTVVNNTAANVGAIIKGASSQTGNLLQVQNSAATSLVIIDSVGNVGIGTTTPSTYGLLGFGVANSGSTNTPVIGMYQAAAADLSGLRIAGYAYTGVARTTIDFIQNSLSNFQSQIAFSTTGAGSAFAERMRIDSSGNITSSGGGIGYGTGAGGTVTQATSKATGVTLSKVTGQITMNNAALTANTTVSFTLTNTTIAATDMVLVQHISAGTVGAYVCSASPAAGSATVYVRNVTSGSLSEAIVLQFAIIRAVTA